MKNKKIILVILVLAAPIAFFASGSYQHVVYLSPFSSMTQSTLCKFFWSTTDLITDNLMEKYIVFPANDEKCQKASDL